MIGGIGTPELIIILIVALLLFGAKRLPEIGRAIGKGIREIRNASDGIMSDDEEVYKDIKDKSPREEDNSENKS
ncbi:MAG: twin-arginine translocase TatA/TatE family subunit [Candidatus Coatesbacteria bacterium]|nr:MAG: twin-arginine translocase TatA/TatE family subunit [Candidatus Coatesbacteria bacterium]RLC42392.1 MAG: twin-arginine translocase TatA/TatE family subunit [Candidatus Coatesbacteria bacterium]RLC42739.1 MAG: twin-arginine translocase TatA/TatE family subunit [Candidatus Coatesbacteria bacterium]